MNSFSRDLTAKQQYHKNNGFQSLKQSSLPYSQNSTFHKFTYNTQLSHSQRDQYYYMSYDKPNSNLYLKKHEVFPGYTLHKPLSLQKSQNIDRSREGCTQTNKRHFLNLSIKQIDDWMTQQNYLAVTKLVIKGFIDILKKKLRKQNREISSADDLVLLETCAIKGLITYPDFISLNNIVQNYESATQKKVEAAESIPYSAHNYSSLPNYQKGTYDFSHQSSFKHHLSPLNKRNAQEALRILIDFIKNEVEQQSQTITNTVSNYKYEPFLTHLIELRDRMLDY